MKNIPCLFFLAACVFAGCNNDDNSNNNNNNNNSTCTGATMTVVLSGASSTHTEFNNTLLKATSNGQAARRLDLRTTVASGTLVVSASNWDFQNPPTDGVLEKSYSTLDTGPGISCTTMNGLDYCDGALVTYIETATGKSYFSVDDAYSGFVDIDVCNGNDKFVSGTFDAKLTDFTDTIVVSGSFTHLCYTVF